jgi:adenine/guanine/hypoxanthine permease
MAELNWWHLERGDIDATVAQVGFNLAQMMIPVFLLAPAGIPFDFSITHLLPGYALGFIAGSLGLAMLAVRLARREQRSNVTAHVYGNNVPAIIAYTLSIMLPVYLQTHDPFQAWEIGAAAVVWTGIFKLLAAPFAGVLRKLIPPAAALAVFGAAMYSYLAMVLLQRIFDQPMIGLIALAIVGVGVLAGVPVTRWRIPPFLVAWLVPLTFALGIGYVHPVWQGLRLSLPWVASLGPLNVLPLALPYLSVIAPMAIYQILQDIAAVAGASAAGDDYDPRSVLFWDGIGSLLCGVAGSVVTPVVYAMHPAYKHIGARIGFSFWTPIIFLAVVISGLTFFVAQLFPWSILSAMIAYVSIGVGLATLRRVEPKYLGGVLLGLMLPAGAVVAAAINSALPALGIAAGQPQIQAALNRSIYWPSVQGLGNGFLFLVLVVTALVTELINRNFGRASMWCLIAAAFSWVGLMHSATMRWGAQPQYTYGWLVSAAIVYSARWWGRDVDLTRS